MNYYIDKGEIVELPDETLDEWRADPLREGWPSTLYHGDEGKKMAERVLQHPDEISALQQEAKERLMLTEDEYELWHYGPENRNEMVRLERALARSNR